uniref:Uncharacterized protein n=1 Tax=Meloidogyne enterolobii TaxID=390850 RepID=A0A6V7TX07_MELEN|nr:unnamed protein product [Meloidogyne enterolobii]
MIDSLEKDSYEIKRLGPVVFEFMMNDQLVKKWRTAIAESVPLFLHGVRDDSAESDDESEDDNEEETEDDNEEEDDNVENDIKDFTVQLIKPGDKKFRYILKVPKIPKSIEEMIILRVWLEQLLNCAFEKAQNIIFNPQIVDLLFDNDKSMLKQFHVQSFYLEARNNTIENFLKFGLNRFAIYEYFDIVFRDDISEQHINILFNIIKNEGRKLPQVSFGDFDCFRLYDLIVEYITTSKDFSKMVCRIFLFYHSLQNFKLPKSAKNVKKEGDSTEYQIDNIYNPKMKFSFSNTDFPGGTSDIYIRKMEE